MSADQLQEFAGNVGGDILVERWIELDYLPSPLAFVPGGGCWGLIWQLVAAARQGVLVCRQSSDIFLVVAG